MISEEWTGSNQTPIIRSRRQNQSIAQLCSQFPDVPHVTGRAVESVRLLAGVSVIVGLSLVRTVSAVGLVTLTVSGEHSAPDVVSHVRLGTSVGWSLSYQAIKAFHPSLTH
jgi:hypothetical protein